MNLPSLLVAGRNRLALAYFVLSMLAIVAIDAIVPPFAAPDEFPHAFRAASLSFGQLFPVKGADRWLGVTVDASFVDVFQTLWLTAGQPAPPPAAASAEAREIHWSGRPTFFEIPSTGLYGPLLYLPQAAGLTLGRIMGLSVIGSYELARLLTGFVAVGIASLAIAWAERGLALLLVVLSTPMFLFLAASLSQDGPLIATSALFAALATRPTLAPVRGWIAWFCALLIAMGRGPYALLSVLFLRSRAGRPFGTWLRAPDGPLAPLLLFAIVGLWLVWIGAASQRTAAADPSVDPHAQLIGLLADPARVLRVAVDTITKDQIHRLSLEAVGVLGGLSITLSDFAYEAGRFAFELAVAACILQRPAMTAASRLLFALMFLLSLGAVYAALYVTWTPVNAPAVDGVQGRYMLPFLAALPCILPSLADVSRSRPRLVAMSERIAATAGLGAWAIMIAVTVKALFVLDAVYGVTP
ncbi:MAG TPA: DUF2142 domain-containing protein [Aliidongia sp.]|nr:DUF2142 domain-containing protein [Aliidongia sp.]